MERKIAEAGVSMADYMRQAALQAEVRAKWTEEERAMVKALIGMSADLHRLAGAAYDAGDEEPAAYFLALRDRMDEIIKKLCHVR